MTHLAGACDTRAAQRLTNTIFGVRFVLIGLIALAAVPPAVVLRENGAAFAGVILTAAIAALSIYVTFGWLEQTLVLLIGIAYNTAEPTQLARSEPESRAPANSPDTTPKPSHWSDRQERAYQHLMGDSTSPDRSTQRD